MKRIFFSCLSDTRKEKEREAIESLKKILSSRFSIILSSYAFSPAPAEEKAEEFNKAFSSSDFVIDISGGDSAERVIPFLDWDCIKNSHATFCGYSDLTCILNAIYYKCGKEGLLFNPKNILYSERIRDRFLSFLSEGSPSIADFKAERLWGRGAEGVLVGGNIRCFLKTVCADINVRLDEKILLLESLSAMPDDVERYLSSITSLPFSESLNAVILGTFTRAEEKGMMDKIVKSVLSYFPNKSVFQTHEVGHSVSSLAAFIGCSISL